MPDCVVQAWMSPKTWPWQWKSWIHYWLKCRRYGKRFGFEPIEVEILILPPVDASIIFHVTYRVLWTPTRLETRTPVQGVQRTLKNPWGKVLRLFRQWKQRAGSIFKRHTGSTSDGAERAGVWVVNEEKGWMMISRNEAQIIGHTGWQVSGQGQHEEQQPSEQRNEGFCFGYADVRISWKSLSKD